MENSIIDDEIKFLFNLPVYQHIGPGAYKPGLETTRVLDKAFGLPSTKFKSIHIAGTNGKGSTAHTLASILQEAGYKVGLYTSPHIFDFRERIRINGKKIDPSFVKHFVAKYKSLNLDREPSFFELTTILAFSYFACRQVDVGVIETGLGGRLDSTNILMPLLSIITNISLDHMALLGDTVEKIASEKAGIIKPGVPVIIGEAETESLKKVFIEKARFLQSPISFANPIDFKITPQGIDYDDFRGELSGECQPKNTATILKALPVLKTCFPAIDKMAITRGFASVTDNTGLIGRWQQVASSPRVVIDTGHNIGAWKYISDQIASDASKDKHLIIGFVADKDLTQILDLIAGIQNLDIYFATPSGARGLKAQDLALQAARHGVNGTTCGDVNQALELARSKSTPEGLIVIAGSNFLISDLRLDF